MFPSLPRPHRRRPAVLRTPQDHKAVGDGDTGPNTGGMGAYSPAPVVTPAVVAQVMRDMVQPTVSALRKEGMPFVGVLFAGLMVEDGRAQLLEYNVRFGDPECQTLMVRLKSDLVQVLLAACQGRLKGTQLEWSDDPAVVVVVAAKGYPGSFSKGEVIGCGAQRRAGAFLSPLSSLLTPLSSRLSPLASHHKCV